METAVSITGQQFRPRDYVGAAKALREWARSMPSCGQYAVDSLNVVLYGILENPSSDTWLQRYVNWRRDHPQ